VRWIYEGEINRIGGKMGRKNIDKTWRDIIQEIEKDDGVLWHYVTALRGPDVDSPYVKGVFTCPLRGRCAQALDVEEYLGLDAVEIMDGFTFAFESRHKLRHYIQHIISVWKDFYPPIACVLEDVFFRGDITPPITGATHYVKLLNEWLESKDVIMHKGE